jgi:hypothetical protein
MAITSITITNPGAEIAIGAEWTGTTNFGRLGADSGVTPRTGSYMFYPGTLSSGANFYQTVAVPGALEAAIDGGGTAFKLAAYHACKTADPGDGGYLFMQCLAADGTTVLGTFENDWSSPDVTWVLEELSDYIPANTRFFKFGTYNTRDGSAIHSFWEDFTLEVADDPISDWSIEAYANQLGIYAIGNAPAEEAQATQLGLIAAGAAEESSGFHDVLAHQLGVYALVKGFPDRRDIAAWTFTQDDHDFYVLQLGAVNTLVYDTLTKQWSDWRSPGYTYWRAIDGVAWEGYNVAIDPLSNKIWEIDPIGRLDYETTPIRSIVTGMFSERYRKHVNCFMAELAVSEAEPPTGIDASTVGISLRTYTQAGTSATDHGEVTGENSGDDITVRWYGLGLAKAPGHVFEIIDTGYARRIDGFDVDIGDFANGAN